MGVGPQGPTKLAMQHSIFVCASRNPHPQSLPTRGREAGQKWGHRLNPFLIVILGLDGIVLSHGAHRYGHDAGRYALRCTCDGARELSREVLGFASSRPLLMLKWAPH